jgi:hypothetical protein
MSILAIAPATTTTSFTSSFCSSRKPAHAGFFSFAAWHNVAEFSRPIPISPIQEFLMSKAQDSKKETKKEPAKTTKEKKEAKKVKKDARK